VDSGKDYFHTIIRHGQDGDLGDGSVSTFDTTSSFIDGRQVSVHVACHNSVYTSTSFFTRTWITSSSWHFFSGSTDFSQGVRIRRHVRQDDQHVLLQLISIILGRGKSQTRGNDSLDGRVVGEIQEERDSVQRSVLFEIRFEESRRFHVDTHSREYYREVVLVTVQRVFGWTLDETGLSADLRGDLCRRKRIPFNVTSHLLHYVADQRQRRWESFDHGRSSSSRQWLRCPSESFPQDRYENKG
jgi:hypothetical protein